MRIYISEIVKKEGKKVELKGWVNIRRDHGKIIFIDLRDKSGICQLVFIGSEKEMYKKAETLRPEWVIGVVGKVNKRPPAMVNKELPTGEYEVLVDELEILTEAKTPPFDLSTSGHEVNEEVRMEYRYLDLRRQRMKKNLENRHKVNQFIRDFLTDKGFTEVETPVLGKSTPEGARDYLVPARLHAGKFYALPQSPQQYKQLLMVAGLEKYFQIVRCFRDEDTRGDRQPEFTQLDIEMSFVEEDDVLDLIEKLFLNLVKELYPNKKIKLDEKGRIIRMPYKEVMEKYNTDKPDIRDNKDDPDELAFLFAVNFPMFEWKETEKRWDAVHHPFTMPKVKNLEDFNAQFKKDPSKILANQYDFVLNGYEIAGGSIRIHDPKLLAAVFEAMGNKPEDIQEKFGHMLKAFDYGVPPHGGIAAGLDRVMAILENEPSIREVIAFPKTGDGRDLLMGAPSEVAAQQLKELHINIEKHEQA